MTSIRPISAGWDVPVIEAVAPYRHECGEWSAAESLMQDEDDAVPMGDIHLLRAALSHLIDGIAP